MLHWSTLGEERKALLKILVDNMPLPGSYLAGDTASLVPLDNRPGIDALGIMAPGTAQVAALQKQGGPQTGPVFRRHALNIEYGC